jgi:hypothetical protein
MDKQKVVCIIFVYAYGMEFEGYIDKYGMPVLKNPQEPIMGIDGELIYQGAINYWENEVESLKNDPDALNEFYRQFPRDRVSCI